MTLDAIEASSRMTAPRVFGYAGFSAGPYSLNFGGSGAWTSYDTTRVTLRLRFRHADGIRPHLSVSYRRELGDADTTTEVQFADKPESGFAVEGLGFGKNTTTALGGVTVHTGSGIEYTLDYEARHAAGQTAQHLHFRLRFK